LVRKSPVFLNVLLFLVFAIGGCKAQNASASGALSTETAHRIESEIRSRYGVPPQVGVTFSDPTPSEMSGYDKFVVTFTHDQKKTNFDFLISKDRKTLARLEKIDISQDLMSKIDTKGRPMRGGENAKVTIVNFDDFQCPFCARMHATLFPGLLKAYDGRVKIIYKDYPLVEIHPWAMHAAVDANCLAAQNNDAYWDYADYVHGNQKEVAGHNPAEAYANLDKAALQQGDKHHLDNQKLKACVEKNDEKAVRDSIAEGDRLGVDSTPTLFINGERVSGAVPEEAMRSIIDRALMGAGEKASATSAKN
jgi:protein-disulfide isomerase